MSTARPTSARADRRIPLDIYINKMIDGVPHMTRTRDISRRGMFLHRLLEPEASVRARINLEFVLPGTDEVIWTDAEIVHGRGSRKGVGVRFVDLPPHQAAIIRDFIESSSACTRL